MGIKKVEMWLTSKGAPFEDVHEAESQEFRDKVETFMLEHIEGGGGHRCGSPCGNICFGVEEIIDLLHKHTGPLAALLQKVRRRKT